MQKLAAERLYGLLHEDAPFHDGTFKNWAKKPSRDFPFHHLDGVSVWVAEVDVDPEDNFLGRVAEKPQGEQDEAADQGGEGG